MDQISTWFDKDSIRARVGEGVRVRLKLIIAVVVSLGFLEATIVIAGASDEQGGRAKVLIIGDSVFDAFDHVASAREQLVRRQSTSGCLHRTSLHRFERHAPSLQRSKLQNDRARPFPRQACNTCSGSCSGRSLKYAGRARYVQSCQSGPQAHPTQYSTCDYLAVNGPASGPRNVTTTSSPVRSPLPSGTAMSAFATEVEAN